MLDNNIQNKASEPQVTTLQREAVGSKGSVVPFILGATVIALIGLMVVAFRYASLNNSIKQAQTKLSEANNQYLQVQEYGDRVNKLATVLSALDDASSKQIAYKAVLELLENSTYKQAKVTSLNIKDSGNISISGTAGSYNEFAKLIKSIRGGRDDNPQGLTSSISFGSVSQDFVKQLSGETEVQVPATSFTISFNLKNELFLNPASFVRSSLKPDESPADVNLAPIESTETSSPPPAETPEEPSQAEEETETDDVLDAFSDSINTGPPGSSNL